MRITKTQVKAASKELQDSKKYAGDQVAQSSSREESQYWVGRYTSLEQVVDRLNKLLETRISKAEIKAGIRECQDSLSYAEAQMVQFDSEGEYQYWAGRYSGLEQAIDKLTKLLESNNGQTSALHSNLLSVQT